MTYYTADYKTDTSPSQSEEKHLVLIIINCERAQKSQDRPELFGGPGQNTLLGVLGGLFHSQKFPFGGPVKPAPRGKLPSLPPTPTPGPSARP